MILNGRAKPGVRSQGWAPVGTDGRGDGEDTWGDAVNALVLVHFVGICESLYLCFVHFSACVLYFNKDVC